LWPFRKKAHVESHFAGHSVSQNALSRSEYMERRPPNEKGR
jgi:hypothetical protein